MPQATRRNGRRRETQMYEKDLIELNAIRIQQWKKMELSLRYITIGYHNGNRRSNHFVGKIRTSLLNKEI